MQRMETLWKALQKRTTPVGVVGLGYVGLPLAHAFAGHFNVVGYDFNADKVALLKKGVDPTGEVPPGGLQDVEIEFSAKPAPLAKCRFIVIAVPTPIDRHKRPDFTPLIGSSTTVGKILEPGTVVVYESTVYPGVTEEICVPILERESGLVCGRDFHVGYSPERINPGDHEHRLEGIVKVVSGDTPTTLDLVARVYGKIIKAGIHKASSIKVAEAAKVIENTQRDLNIALMNELAIIFHRMGIDTSEVLAAAGTKWNFLKFVPGLVGGHCIGVDPYYLTFKAEELGYHPEVILAGRRINDGMGKFIAENTVKELIRAGHTVRGARVLILGITFKENCADTRNTRVVDIVAELKEYGVESIIHDPLASPAEVHEEYGDIGLAPRLEGVPQVNAIILAVAHKEFRSLSLARLASLCGHHRTTRGKGAAKSGKSASDEVLPGPVLIDVKAFFRPDDARGAGFAYWRL